jgi:hypothetical protein
MYWKTLKHCNSIKFFYILANKKILGLSFQFKVNLPVPFLNCFPKSDKYYNSLRAYHTLIASLISFFSGFSFAQCTVSSILPRFSKYGPA